MICKDSDSSRFNIVKLYNESTEEKNRRNRGFGYFWMIVLFCVAFIAFS